MPREIDVIITVAIPDNADERQAGESLFDTLAEFADEDLILSVDDWKVVQ